MPKIEKDSFAYEMRRYLKFHKSTLMSESIRERVELNKKHREFVFGLNQKKDNFHKTKQLKLF